MMWCVMAMNTLTDSYVFIEGSPYTLISATDVADRLNTGAGKTCRYFVVSEQEYNRHWKGVIQKQYR